MKEWVQFLQTQTPCNLESLIERAHQKDPNLKAYYEKNASKFTYKPTDKGFTGKRIEFALFGRLPNNSSEADLGNEGDLKVTHVKQFRNLGYNAKERLTLTNCGSTNDYSSLQHLLDTNCLAETRLYKKIQKGVVVVLQHGTTDIIAIFQYDIETLPDEIQTVLRDDYAKIQECIRMKAVTQAGQQFLHIHPHGSKGSKTRALGFTNKFLTRLIAHYTNRPLVIQGKSWFVSNDLQ